MRKEALEESKDARCSEKEPIQLRKIFAKLPAFPEYSSPIPTSFRPLTLEFRCVAFAFYRFKIWLECAFSRGGIQNSIRVHYVAKATEVQEKQLMLAGLRMAGWLGKGL